MTSQSSSSVINFGNREEIITTTIYYTKVGEAWVETHKTVETVNREREMKTLPLEQPIPYQRTWPYQQPPNQNPYQQPVVSYISRAINVD